MRDAIFTKKMRPKRRRRRRRRHHHRQVFSTRFFGSNFFLLLFLLLPPLHLNWWKRSVKDKDEDGILVGWRSVLETRNKDICLCRLCESFDSLQKQKKKKKKKKKAEQKLFIVNRIFDYLVACVCMSIQSRKPLPVSIHWVADSYGSVPN